MSLLTGKTKTDFSLTTAQLVEIADVFSRRIRIGLENDGTEIKCLPAHVFPSPDWISGAAYALDLGGSHLRAAVVDFKENIAGFRTPVKTMEIPWTRNVPFPKPDFLRIQAELIRSLDFDPACPLGYCFSYPATSLPNGDAALIRWTKGVHVPETEGHSIGAMLTAYIRKHHPEIRITQTCVINDTVAGLFAGLTGARKDAYIGLIVGTGTNMAAIFPIAGVPKLPDPDRPRKQIPINLECGNFAPPFLNQWDRIIDAESENRGEQLFEKAASGMYLGRLFKAAVPESGFDAESGALGLFDFLKGSHEPQNWEKQVAGSIIQRSADLIAAQLAGLILVLSGMMPVRTLHIAAEGGLFWSEINGRNVYAEIVKIRLKELLSVMKIGPMETDFFKIHQANLIGSAMAALSISRPDASPSEI